MIARNMSRYIVFMYVLATMLVFSSIQANAQVTSGKSAEDYASDATFFLLEKRYSDALTAIRKARELNPGRPEYAETEATILSEWVQRTYEENGTLLTNQYRMAMNAYDEARKLYESSGGTTEVVLNIRLEKATLAMVVNDVVNAQRELQAILREYPNDVRANYMLGILYRNEYNRTGNESLYTASQQLFERAVLNNTNAKYQIPYAYFYVGVSKMDEGRNREALIYLRLWLYQIENSGRVLNGMDRYMVFLAEQYIEWLK